MGQETIASFPLHSSAMGYYFFGGEKEKTEVLSALASSFLSEGARERLEAEEWPALDPTVVTTGSGE